MATTAKINPRFPLPGMATWDKATEIATAQATCARSNPPRLAVGHGNVVEAPGRRDGRGDRAAPRAAERRCRAPG